MYIINLCKAIFISYRTNTTHRVLTALYTSCVRHRRGTVRRSANWRDVVASPLILMCVLRLIDFGGDRSCACWCAYLRCDINGAGIYHPHTLDDYMLARVVIFSPHKRHTSNAHYMMPIARSCVRACLAGAWLVCVFPLFQTSFVRADTNSAVRRIDVVVSVRDNERVRLPVLRDQMD